MSLAPPRSCRRPAVCPTRAAVGYVVVMFLALPPTSRVGLPSLCHRRLVAWACPPQGTPNPLVQGSGEETILPIASLYLRGSKEKSNQSFLSLYTEPAHPSVADDGRLVEGHQDCVPLWHRRGVPAWGNNDGRGGLRA